MELIIPFITLGIGLVSGWTMQLMFTARSERRSDLIDVRNKYLQLTEEEPCENLESFRLSSLAKAGALRLRTKEFEVLLSDICKHGRPVVLPKPFDEIFTIRLCLEIAHDFDLDLCKPAAMHQWFLA